ncbi:MAG: GNAT family N-acetyltransferase [Rubrivivax sp.]
MRLGGAPPTKTAPGFTVRVVDADNLSSLLKLAVTPEQRAYVADVAWSVAQAAYEPAGRPLGLFDGERPVGFLLLYDARRDGKNPADQLYVWRLMIDAAEQRKGYGTLAMGWVIEEARRMGLAEVGLSHAQANPAGALYEKLGFTYTGKVEDGELKMELRLSESKR